jgi:hypothetical protein
MLTERQVATLRAALLFWQEEMCPHDEATRQPYYDEPDVGSLTAVEISFLRDRLSSDVRFALYDPAKHELQGPILYNNRNEAELAAEGLKIATVILPPAVE